MYAWNPNADIKRAAALSQLRRGLIEWLDKQRTDDPELWRAHGEDFLGHYYRRESMRREWQEAVDMVIATARELQVCEPAAVMETWLETLESYYHEHYVEVSRQLGRPPSTPFTPKQSVERLLGDLLKS